MRGRGAPYGEARRLRYFVLISSELLESPSIDIDLFIDRLLKAVGIINPKLSQYVRETGIIQSRAVARNYLRFADWLNLLRIENRIVVPSSYTVFLANLNGCKDFSLTNKEKIAFFLKLTELEEFVRLIGLLRIKNSIKDFIELLGLSEHFVESYFEWLVDFGILRPTRRKFGLFTLSNLGYQISEACRNKHQKLEISGTYVESLLETKLDYELRISEDDFWNTFMRSLNKLGQHTRSEVDSQLYSAYPLILDLQIQLIFDYQLLVSTSLLIKELKDISPNHNTIFSWDSLAGAGYIKLSR